VYSNWDSANVLTTVTGEGKLNAVGTVGGDMGILGPDSQQGDGYGNITNYTMFMQRAVTYAEMDAVAAALAQNQTDYTDPDCG